MAVFMAVGASLAEGQSIAYLPTTFTSLNLAISGG